MGRPDNSRLRRTGQWEWSVIQLAFTLPAKRIQTEPLCKTEKKVVNDRGTRRDMPGNNAVVMLLGRRVCLSSPGELIRFN